MFKEYALFDIRIRGSDPDHCTVEVRSELGGDASIPFTSPASNAAYQPYIDRLQQLDTDEDMLVELGQLLFAAIFSGRVKEVYTRSQGKLAADQGLRLRFDIDPALGTISAMPWEFLYDPDQGPLIMLDAPIVRYLALQSAPPMLKTSLPLKVLLTGAVTPPEPNVKLELDEVRSALTQLEQQGHVQVEVEEHLTRATFQRLLRSGFHIWHFIGHGALSRDGSSGTLLFEDGTGSPEAVSARELSILLNRSGLQLIVLDSCSSAELMTDPYRTVAPALIRAQVGAVIAMQFKVPQAATRAFAAELYRTLAEGYPIDACVTEARKAVVGASGLRNPDWGIPVIYTRAPDGKLFDLPVATPVTVSAQNSGTNVVIESGQVLTDASLISISNIGNTTITGGSDQDAERAEQIADLQQLIYGKKRRLQQLKLQAAKYGISVPPEVATEIEDLDGMKDYRGNLMRPGEIAKLESELKELGG